MMAALWNVSWTLLPVLALQSPQCSKNFLEATSSACSGVTRGGGGSVVVLKSDTPVAGEDIGSSMSRRSLLRPEKR